MGAEVSIRMTHGSIHDFRGRPASSASTIGDSVLRADRHASSCAQAQRAGGYDPTVVYRLAIIQHARQLGFSLSEIRQLFFGFRDVTRPPVRWRALSQRKLAELDQRMGGIKVMRTLLKRLMTKCRCDTFDQCGKGIFQSMNGDLATGGRRLRVAGY